MIATAVIYRHDSNTTGGILTIFQNNNGTPVVITGMISGLNGSRAHVCLIKNQRIFRLFFILGFSCSYKFCIRTFSKLYSSQWSF
jgi:hypothetical protein